MGAYYDTYDAGAEDRTYEDSRQRDLDEANESHRAFFAGKEARRDGATAGMNPYQSDHEFRAWARGWTEVDGQITAETLARRAA